MAASRFFRASLLGFSETLRQRRRVLFGGLGPLLRGGRILRNLSQLSDRSRLRLGHGADLLARRLEFSGDVLQFVVLNRRCPAPLCACLALSSERGARLIEFSLDRGDPRKALAYLCRSSFCA